MRILQGPYNILNIFILIMMRNKETVVGVEKKQSDIAMILMKLMEIEPEIEHLLGRACGDSIPSIKNQLQI